MCDGGASGDGIALALSPCKKKPKPESFLVFFFWRLAWRERRAAWLALASHGRLPSYRNGANRRMVAPEFWVKSLHIIAVISWMAGMLYLPRLFVYHAGVQPHSEASELFKVMERRLLRGIMTPALLVVVASGLWLAWREEFFASPWLHAKLALVLGLLGLHGFFARQTRAFAQDRNTRSPRFFRLINEVPTVLMILIVLLVVIKPF
jgi:protoporphyrinogen IX oxidase